MAGHRPKHLGHRSRRRRVLRAVATVVTAIVAAVLVTVGVVAVVDRDGTSRTQLAGAVPSSSTTSAPSTTTTPPRRGTMVFGGDVLVHSAVWGRAAVPDGFDFSPMFDPLAPRLRAADTAICHLEVTLARPGEPPSSYPRFRAPAVLARDLAEAGFDGCSVSSNHALDFGARGVDATLDALDQAGVRHVGTARNAHEDVTPVIYDVAGIRVAHLSYSYGFNGFLPPADAPWLVDAIDAPRIIRDAEAMRAVGAELVVVSLHWGAEYRHDPMPDQVALAEALAASRGVDLVIGHHAHVVQPITRIGDMWVAYGLGNLLSNNTPRGGRLDVVDGLVVEVTVGDGRRSGAGPRVLDVTAVPTWNERATFAILPVVDALADPATPQALAPDLRASLARTLAHVQAMGGERLGVRVA